MYIYTNTSIHNLRLTNSIVTPVAFSPVTSQYGAQTTDGVVEFDGKHLVVGSNDIYLFSGNPGNIASIADTRIRDYFYNNLTLIFLANFLTSSTLLQFFNKYSFNLPVNIFILFLTFLLLYSF